MPASSSPLDGLGNHFPPGSEHPWPIAATLENDLCLLEGEIALIGVLRSPEGQILRRRMLGCYAAPCLLPALPRLPAELEVRFKVVQAATLAPLEKNGSGGGNSSFHPPAAVPNPLGLLGQLQNGEPAQAPQEAHHDPLATLVGWLAEHHGTTLVPLAHVPANPTDRLQIGRAHV